MSGKKAKHSKKSRKAKGAYPNMPNSLCVTLPYDVRTQHSSTSFTVYNFDILQLTTFQPYYRDQILAIYGKYVVMGITVETRLVNRSTTVDAQVLQYYGTGTTISSLTLAAALEYKTTRKDFLSTSGNKKSLLMRYHVDPKSILRARYWDDSDFWGTPSANPPYCTSADSVQFATAVIAADGTSSVLLTMDRKIKFHVKFFGLLGPANSVGEKPVLTLGNDNPHSDDDDSAESATFIPSSLNVLPVVLSRQGVRTKGLESQTKKKCN